MKFKVWSTLVVGALLGGMVFLLLVALGFFVWMFAVLLRFLVIGAVVAVIVALLLKAAGGFFGKHKDTEKSEDAD